MTREEALMKMQAVKAYMTSGNPIWSVTEMTEAFDLAIEAMKEQKNDSTIYGFSVRDLVPLASILRAKGVSPKEVTDWHEGLQRLMDFVLDQEKEALQKAVADLLKGLEGPDKETGEWFMKAIGRKGEEG